MEGFTIEGWDDFVENFSKFVDKWADKKKILLQRMANIYHGEVKVGELIVGAVSNPYVLSLVAVSVWNTLNDPTTKGLGDSARAKSYTAPQ